jgi:hypothetical protein
LSARLSGEVLAEADAVAAGEAADGAGGDCAKAVAASAIEQTQRNNVFIFIL